MDKTKKKIYNAYTTWVVENKKRPEFIEAFVIEAAISEETFLKYFDSFKSLEKSFWKELFTEAVTKTSLQSEFAEYSVNEKLLGFYFTWIETMKEYRDFVVFTLNKLSFYELYPSEFESLKKYFEEVVRQLVAEGIASGEIANRPWIADKYQHLLWSQPVMILRFWVKDTSENLSGTDALIEKTVNFSFDLMRSNSLDSFVDLAKFHIQHR
ncbi:MAG: TetR family transcriptional regulator C-terminal domain-containing protein [Cyclobacteriaceae bacterium]|nr:TetR family transcriptional regulator C-terminal domain-containing protein [Cyclobacteriaceae bacterium]